MDSPDQELAGRPPSLEEAPMIRLAERGKMIECEEGEKDLPRTWEFQSVFHRDHGPAVEHAGGGMEWWVHGKL